ncbi:hypothetical protein KY348_06670 [Candidatus Woesearchaeota archaeon]|nr:hypothetical protein [Candidatus Woesearchaeota archaeon]
MFKKSICLFVLIVFLITVFFSANAFADEKKKSRLWWLTLDFEIMRISSKRTLDFGAVITEVRESFRKMKIHPDDPSFTLKGIVADESPFILPLSSNIATSSVKVWFLKTIAFGLVFSRGQNGPYLPDIPSAFGSYTALKEDEVVFGVAKRNYMADYDVYWGPAYHMYRLSVVEEPSLSYLVEVKTPILNLVKLDDGDLGIGFYAGYQPRTFGFSIHATKGWHRYGEFEPLDRYKLGEVSFSQRYYGLNLAFVSGSWDWGLKFFASKDRVESSISSHGEDFGLELLDDVPLLYGFSFYISFRIF